MSGFDHEVISERDLIDSISNLKLAEIRSHVSMASNQPFLKKFPREIRDMVYKYLLINPLLGEPYPVEIVLHASPNYHLHPAILRVSKQVHHEGMEILYGCNRFFMASWEYWDDPGFYRTCDLSPITRYEQPRLWKFSNLQNSYAIKHVKHWNVHISPFRIQSSVDRLIVSHLTHFCRVLVMQPPESLHFIISRLVTGITVCSDMTANDSAAVLHPLLLLRNVKEVKFQNNPPQLATPNAYGSFSPRSVLPTLETQQQLSKVMKIGVMDEPCIEYPWLQYGAVLRYAQAFERLSDFRGSTNLSMSVQTPEHAFANLYPADIWLAEAGEEVGKQNLDPKKIKALRRDILSYLEPQYERIKSAGFRLNEFIKCQKQRGGLFDPQLESESVYKYSSIAAEAMVLAEDYLNAFDRDLAWAFWNRIDTQKPVHRSTRSSLSRTRAFHALSNYYNNNDDHLMQFPARFRLVVDEYDRQYLGILRARKSLFEWDLDHKFFDRECDLEINMGASEEMVLWDVTEPFIGPRECETK